MNAAYERPAVAEAPAKDTYCLPILTSISAVFGSIGLLAAFLLGAYILLLHYAYWGENFLLVGADSRSEVSTMYAQVRGFEVVAGALAVFSVFFALLGYLFAGVVKRLFVWLFLAIYLVIGFLTLINILLNDSFWRSLPFFLLTLFYLFIIFVLIPLLMTLKPLAGSNASAWQRYSMILIPLTAVPVLLGLVLVYSSLEAFDFSIAYLTSDFLPEFISVTSVVWMIPALASVVIAFVNRKRMRAAGR